MDVDIDVEHRHTTPTLLMSGPKFQAETRTKEEPGLAENNCTHCAFQDIQSVNCKENQVSLPSGLHRLGPQIQRKYRQQRGAGVEQDSELVPSAKASRYSCTSAVNNITALLEHGVHVAHKDLRAGYKHAYTS